MLCFFKIVVSVELFFLVETFFEVWDDDLDDDLDIPPF